MDVQIYSIGIQPSRFVLARITAPVFLVLARNDKLFDVSGADDEKLLFAGSNDVSVHIVEDAGHVFPLQENAPQTAVVIGDWLDAHMPH